VGSWFSPIPYKSGFQGKDAMQPPDEDRVRTRAQQIWEAEGKPEGRSKAHWEMARDQLAIEQHDLNVMANLVTGESRFAPEVDKLDPIFAADEAIGDSGTKTQAGEAPDGDRASAGSSRSYYISHEFFSTNKTYTV
jgi:hypothetical protein